MMEHVNQLTALIIHANAKMTLMVLIVKKVFYYKNKNFTFMGIFYFRHPLDCK